MNITCEKCGVAFDARGASEAACPACHHLNRVVSLGAGAREISLSSLGDDEPAEPLKTPSFSPPADESLLADDVDFGSVAPPQLATPSARPPAKPIMLGDDAELPTPKRPPLPASARPPVPPALDVVDLPAPRAARPPVPSSPGSVDLPTPKKPPLPPSLPSAAKVPPKIPGAAPPAAGRSMDAPHHVSPQRTAPPPVASPLDLDAMPLDLDAPDLAAPDLATPDHDAPDLDAPDVDDQHMGDDVVDLPAPRFGAGSGSVDLPTPRLDEDADLPTPVHRDDDADLPAPRISSTPGHDAEGPSAQIREQLEALKNQPKRVPIVTQAPPEAPKSRRRAAFIAGGAVAVLAIGGGLAYSLDLFGGSGSKQVLAETIASAKKAIADDTHAGFLRAAQQLHPLSSGNKPHEEAALLEAQVHFLDAHLGASGELDRGKALLEVPAGKTPTIERPHADALRALLEGDATAARGALKDVTSANASDAVGFTYLGWVELEARDTKAAAAAFTQALTIDASRAGALYGLALANEQLGNLKAASEGYTKVLTLAPGHTRAKLGQFRVNARGGDHDAGRLLDEMLAQQASNFAKREIAEAQESLGEIAVAAGRVDEAEERFKKSLAVDAEFDKSHVAWNAELGLSRVRVNTGRSALAIDDLRKLVAIDTNAVEPRILLAQALVEKRETEEAQTLVGAVEQRAPKDARVALLRGELIEAHDSVSAEDRDKAIEKYKEAVASDPKLIEGWTALARALSAEGKSADALDALAKAANVLSGNARGTALVGQTYLAIGQPAEAEARFRTVLSTGKSSADQLPLWLGLGESLEAQNKLDDAQKAYAEARLLAPKDALFAEKQARLAVRRNRPDEAKKIFDEALKLGTPTATLRIAAGDFALLQKRYDDARTLVEPVVKEDDRNAAANLSMARIELESGHPEDAVGFARRAVTLADLPEAHLVLAQVDEMTNKYEAASSEYNLARRPPTTDKASLGRARVFVLMKSTKDALAELGPLMNGPFKADAMLLAGDCYADLQQLDKARKAYEDAARLAPSSAEAQFKHGRAELDAGKRGPALTALERATSLAPPKTPWLPDAYFNMADAYRQSHQNDGAARAYKKYLAIAPTDAPMREEAQKQLSLLGNPGGSIE